MSFMKKLIQYFKRKKILICEMGYFTSISSNYVHPHLMTIITPKELYKMSDEDFDILTRKL